ncbi:MAG: DMT family transporter [Planctomycetota bacterium]|nr:MAG: DMT family transporter [Planctomycetota bacterium]
MDRKTVGVLAVIGCSLMWAIEPILAKKAFINSDFVQTTGIRTLVVALIAFVYVLISNRGGFRVKASGIPWIVYVALIGTVFADLCYLYALWINTPVLNATLIAHIQPVFIVIMGYFFLRSDRLTRYDYAGIAVMIIAALLVSTQTVENLLKLRIGTRGELIILFATIGWASCGIISRKYLTSIHSGVLVFYRFSIAGLCLAVYLLATSSLMVSNVWQILVGVVVGVGYVLYYEGIKRIKAAQAAALELTSPFFAAVLGFLILGEKVTVMQGAGVALLFAGIWFLSRKESTLA